MERWKAEQGRGTEKRKIRRERVRRQKIQMREKVGKSRNTVFFQWFVAPEGRKVDSLKRRVRSQLARWEMKNCTPLWREAHFQVKMYKTHHSRTLLTWKCASRHNGVHFFNISTSKSGPKLRCFVHFDLEMCFAPQRRTLFQHRNFQKWRSRTTFGGSDVEKVSKKCTPLWREAHFEVKSVKNWVFWAFFDVLMSKK